MNGSGGALNHAEALRAEGNTYFKKGDLQKALDSYERSLFAEKSHLTYANRSLVFFRRGDFLSALADAECAIQLKATPKGYYRQASALRALGRRTQARNACSLGLLLEPANSELLMLRNLVHGDGNTREHAETGRSEEGDQADSDDEEYDEDDVGEDDHETGEVEDEDEEAAAEAMAALAAERAKAFHGRRSTASGIAHAGLAKASEPVHPPPREPAPASAAEYKERGNALYRAGQYEDALHWYSRAVSSAAVEEERALYLCNRAAAQVMLGRVADAAEDAQRASKLDPTCAKAFARAGKCLLQLGHLTEARLALGQALKLAPGTPAALTDMESVKLADALVNEAGRHAQVGQYGQALSAYRMLLRRYCPHSEEIKFQELDAVVRLGGYEEVLQQATQMLRRQPDSPNALYLRGRCLFHNGQLESALKHTAEALRLDPDHAPSKELRSSVKALAAEKEAGNEAFKQRNFDTAIAHYSHALDLVCKRDAIVGTLRVNRATALSKLNRFDDAIVDCTAALDIDPKCVKAIFRRASCYVELERFQDAIADYDLAIERATDRETEHSARNLRRKAKLEKLKSERVDHYKVLDLTKTATPAEIKKAYHKMALKWHPDKNSGSAEEHALAEANFKMVNDAYDILSNPEKKHRYDSGADLDNELDGCGHGRSHVDPEMYHMFQSFMGGGVPRGRRERPGGMPRGVHDV